MATNREVKVLDAILSERQDGEIILTGVIDELSLQHLLVDDYQREYLSTYSGKTSSNLTRAVANNASLPAIEIGMRGATVSSRGTTYILSNDCYIIDGYQRVGTVIRYNDNNTKKTGSVIRALIHFNTTKEWEKERFRILNQCRVAVSPNVILRNVRDKHPSILTLYGLSNNDQKFALYNRVQWGQRMVRGQLITAGMLARAARALHRGYGVGKLPNKGQPRRSVGDAGVKDIPLNLDGIASSFGLASFRKNIITLFDIIDECWGLRKIEFRELSVQTKANFIMAVASIFSNHSEYWDGGKILVVDSATKAKLKKFAIHDPNVEKLASSGTMAASLLYNMMIDHLNKGRRKTRLGSNSGAVNSQSLAQ